MPRPVSWLVLLEKYGGSKFLPDWSEARCADEEVSPDLFFPERNGTRIYVKVARGYCQECLIRATCLKFAMDNDIHHGIWGGTTPNERQALRSLPWERMTQ